MDTKENIDSTNENSFIIPIEPQMEINLEHYNFSDWDFFWSVERMLSSKEMDMISDKVKINRLPDMLFGYNRFYLVNSKNNFLLEINPLHMLDLCNYQEREKKYINLDKKDDKIVKTEEKSEHSNATSDSNFIYYIPNEVKVQYYNKWKNMKIEREDVKKLDPTEDWSFSSSYMGTIGKLKDHRLFDTNSKHFENFDLLKEYKDVEIKQTDESLPIGRLGPDNTILKYMELNLYDDELCDNGLSMGNFRFRVMKDCFFGLLRSYLRVDNVIVRIIDTRLFYSFGDNFILREFQVKENSFDDLTNKGFKFSSEWSLSQGQSDLVSRYMDVTYTIKDKIIFDY